MTFLAIDLGTSFVKGAVLDLDALTISHLYRTPFPDVIPGLHPLQREYDPAAVVSAAGSVVNALLPNAPGCTGLVMCSQMHGLVLTDQQGVPLSHAMTWQDTRSMMPHPSAEGTFFDALSQRITASQRADMGNGLRPGLPVCALYWMRETGRLPHGALAASLADFVLARLCRTAPLTMERTLAMSQGALNQRTMEWHEDVLAGLGLAGVSWPRVCGPEQVVGEMRRGGVRLRCFAPVGDFQASLLGALIADDELSLNISTGSQVTIVSRQPAFGDFETRPFLDGRFLKTVSNVPAGRSLSALVNLLTELAAAQNDTMKDPWSYINAAVSKVRATELVVDLAFFPSSYGNRGSITNIVEENLSIGHLFHAAFANMAANYCRAARVISPGRDWKRLVFSGGLAQRMPALREIVARAFDAPYRVSAVEDESLLGLLALALVVDQRVPSLEEATARLGRVYH